MHGDPYLEPSAHTTDTSCLFVLDMMSQRLQQLLNLDDHTLLPIIEDVRREYLRQTHHRPLIVGDNVVFYDYVLSFKKHTMILELFRVLICAPQQRASIDEIILSVYHSNIHQTSPRKRKCLLNTAGKLIERARKIAAHHLDDPQDPQWNWLVYDLHTKHYILVRPILKALKF